VSSSTPPPTLLPLLVLTLSGTHIVALAAQAPHLGAAVLDRRSTGPPGYHVRRWAALVSDILGGLLVSNNTREMLAGRMWCQHYVIGMATDDSVAEMLGKAKRARLMAEFACSPEDKRMLAGIATDYELLASCQLTMRDTQQHLADSRRLLDGSSPSVAGPDPEGR
jgi:hypothetical protein